MAICASCNKEVEAGVKFCTHCGASMGEAAPAGTPKGGGDKEALSEVKKLFKKLEVADYDEEISMIENFLLPNDKDALLEFIIAASNQERIPAWEAKLQEAFTKAQIIGDDDEKFLRRINTIQAKTSEKAAAEAAEAAIKRKKTIRRVIIGITIVVLFYVVFFAATSSFTSAPPKREIKRLETLQTEILQAIKDGNLTEAKLKAADFNPNKTVLNRNQQETWNGRRQVILQEIENAENQQ